MNCTVCKQGKTQPGTTKVTLERNATTLVVKEVPAQICENCGEAYMAEETTVALLAMLKQSATNGVAVEVRDFSPAHPIPVP
jgi:YgiT-type zinc finger domain-containing protein